MERQKPKLVYTIALYVFLSGILVALGAVWTAMFGGPEEVKTNMVYASLALLVAGMLIGLVGRWRNRKRRRASA